MTDVFSKEERRRVMRSVCSKRNKSTELRLIKIFKQKGIKGWRRNYSVKGKPDFVFLKCKIALFTDGCFWHGHDCRNTRPKDNEAYWNKKISGNMARDAAINQLFRNRGWQVIRIWECELLDKNRAKLEEKLRPLLDALR